MRQNRKTCFAFLLTGIALVVTFLTAVQTGGLDTTVPQLMRGLFVEYDPTVAIIFELRFPRVIVAMLGGGLMAMSGVCMQAVMRNPLADPGIIGVTSGAAFVAVIVFAFFPSLAPWTPLFSFGGGMLAFGIVYVLSMGREVSPVRLILTGIAVDAFFSGLYQAFNAFTGSSYSGATNIINANISLKSWDDVKILTVYAVISIIICILIAGMCNLLSLSDKTIMSLGVEVGKTRVLVSVAAVLFASIFTAVIGSVSFLGLIVPHIARLLVGSDHTKLLPYSALLGAEVFLLADTVGRVVAYPYEISAAIIMAIIGGPMLIVLLKRSGMVNGR